MAKHRSHSVEFKRQVAQEFLAGETLHGLAKRHDVSRNLIRIWVQKHEQGAFDDDAQAADVREGLWQRFEQIFKSFGWDVVILRNGSLQEAIPTRSPGCATRPVDRSTCVYAPARWSSLPVT